MVSPTDKTFIKTQLLPYFNIRRLQMGWSDSKKVWPDIWVQLGDLPVITVTREWARQNMHERRKRLVHECIHITGKDHDESIGYSTYPDKDTYSMKVYKDIISRKIPKPRQKK